jgi:predicted acylesterase/phospholipase RssA
MDPDLRNDLHDALLAAGPPDNMLRPFSLVIRGGISLGVYESGVNWALLRLLKDLRDNPGEAGTVRPELLAAAGASAGAINGFLAGLMWCAEEAENGNDIDTLDSNLLRDTWRSIDINKLLDYSDAPEFEDKAAFTRRLLRKVQERVTSAINQRSFHSSCNVAFGASLTRSKPVLAANAGVHVPQQRLVLPLRIQSDPRSPGAIRMRNLKFPKPSFTTEDQEELSNRPFLASVIYLDGDFEKPVLEADLETGDVFNAIKASASFPVAFAPLKLSYCLYQPAPLRDQRVQVRLKDRSRTPDRRCPENYRRLSSYFVDGGVFDNDPVELVRKLSEQQADELDSSDFKVRDIKVQYIKIDPDRRRPPSDHFKFILPEYAEAGDSIEITLWAGSPAVAKGGTLLRPDKIDLETVNVRHCRSAAPPAGEKREWQKEKDEPYEVVLTETAVNSQLFVGAVHTRPAGGAKARYLAGADIVVEPHDRLLVYSSREEREPICATIVDEEEVNDEVLKFSKLRSIGIVSEVPPGLTTQLRFLGGSVTSARSYRLYDELMSSNWHDGAYENDKQEKAEDSRPLFQPARLTPLVADFLAAFGAFLDERFRDFDYYAGVYDAVYGIAEFLCFSASGSSGDRDACRGNQAQRVYLQLCAPMAADLDARMSACQTSSPKSNAVIYQMVLLETCGVEAAADPFSGRCPLQSHWQWAKDLATPAGPGGSDGASRELLVIGAALLEANDEVSESDQDPFVRFVRKLADKRGEFEPQDNEDNQVLNEMLVRADRPVPTWWYPIAEKAVPRLIDLQDQDAKVREGVGLEASEQAGAVKGTLALTGFAFESEFKEPTGWMWNQTSVPDYANRRWIASIVPSEIAVDSRNGEAAVYWNPGWRFHKDMGIDFRFSPYVRQRLDETTIEFAELTALLTWRLKNPLISSLGIGPTTTYSWSQEEVGKDMNLGASVSMGLMADKLRIAYGWRSFSKDDFPGDPIYLQLGVNDLPGIAYWICRGLTNTGAIGRVCGAD